MKKKNNNYAFIDSQNVNLGVQELGWRLDFKKLIIYLKEKYSVKTAYLFIGYLPENKNLYSSLQKYGYLLIFKPVMRDDNGRPKGNIDADLVLQAMIDYNEYEKAIILTSDGDFYSLVDYLYKNKKLGVVLSPNKDKCSVLLQKSAREKIMFVDNLKRKLEHKK
ncbi:MAG: NYN domain-containing protein [Candidatus Pacebacteria bacterium]|nr:NYN domain-containing protein [Candidatus Paceibacterota bacterium]